MSTDVEVLEPGQLSLRDLADKANCEHSLAMQSGIAMVEHAINAGEALLGAQLQVPRGEWMQWMRENLTISTTTSAAYMRMARYKDRISNGEAKTLNEAHRILA